MGRVLAGGWSLAVLTIGLWISVGATPAVAVEVSEELLDQLVAQNETLARRIEEQDRRISELEGRGVTSTSGSSQRGDESFFSKYPVTFTGFIKADALYGDARMNSSDAPRFLALEPPGADDEDDFYNQTVQHSRFILKWRGPEVMGGTLGAHLETDLFTLGDTGTAKYNNPQFRLRQLFFDAKFESWSVLVGQAWDLFSPLGPSTLNTNGYYWFGGNAGFRRPQVRVTRDFDLGGEHRLVVAASVNSNIGFPNADPCCVGRVVNTGEDQGRPVLESSITYRFPGFDSRPSQFGISGLYGKEEVDGVDSGVNQWAVGIHGELPILSWLAIRGELQHGSNTDAFLMGGGIDATGDPIETTSGWAQLKLGPWRKFSGNLLLGIEDIDGGDVVFGARDRNRLLGANLTYSLTSALEVGLEWTNFDTEWGRAGGDTANLFWLSGKFAF